MSEKQERLEKANALIKTISEHGRKFFEHSGRLSRFEISWTNGRLYYWDKYTNQRLPMSHTKTRRWQRYFSDGGTLKDVIERLGKYIRTGERVNNVFGPWPDWLCNGDLWGYSEDMEIVRNYAVSLGISEEKES